MSRLYLYGALIAAALAFAGVIYAKGRIDAAHKAELAAQAEQLASLTAAIERERALREADAIRAKADAAKRVELESLLMELDDHAENSESGGAVCLDPADTERLLKLWR